MDAYDVLFKFSDFVDFLKKKKWQLESEDIKKIRLLERMQKDEHVVKWLEQPETSRHYSIYTIRRLSELNQIKENLHIPILPLDETYAKTYTQTYIQAWFYDEFEYRELELHFPDHLTCSSYMLSNLENQKLIRVTWNTWLRKDHPRIEITKKGLEAEGLEILRNIPKIKPEIKSDVLDKFFKKGAYTGSLGFMTQKEIHFQVMQGDVNTKSPSSRSTISRKTRHQVFERDNYKCRQCGISKNDSPLEIDHIKPFSKGGAENLNNYQLLCQKCNRLKFTSKWKAPSNKK
jgi:5-methylcytosine-specific restriction enzyme A